LSKEVKVLHIISSLGQGGAERQLVELVMKNKKHAICQLISGGLYEKDLKRNKISIFDLNFKKSILDIFFLYKLNKIIKIYKPDIINTWMYHSSLLEVVLRKITLKNSIPLVWGLRCSNMDTSHYSKQLQIVIKGCKYFSKTPNIIIHNSLVGLNFHKSLGFKNTNIVIHNGIDNKKFSSNEKNRDNFRKKLKINKDAKVLLCVARYDPMKDHKTLLKAFKKIKSFFSTTVLLLAGTGTENIKVTNGLIALGPREDINNIYAASDIIISSSAFGEGFSNALAEGMASSLIPIATNVGDSKYILGNNGKVINPRSEEELFIAIKELLQLNNQTFINRKKLARKRIIEKFSSSKMLSEYNKVYNQLLEE
jgi:glycosyltransferase involved in cell wall biosynthesis